VSKLEEEFEIHGEVKGGMAKGDFRERLRAALPQD
jgi:hypothetical protein